MIIQTYIMILFDCFDWWLTYFVHCDYKWQFGFIENTAGVSHVGHKRDWTDAARSVHYIHHNCRKCGRLKTKRVNNI